MTPLRISPKLHSTLLNESRRGNSLLKLAGLDALTDPDALVISLTVTKKPTKGAADAARFDPVLGGHALRF